MGFPRQEYQSGLPLPSPGDLSDPGIKTPSPALAGRSLPLSHLGHPLLRMMMPNAETDKALHLHSLTLFVNRLYVSLMLGLVFGF